MRQRCEQPKHRSYPDYGGRGISVCQRWQSFPDFLSDMGLRPGPGYSIDRRDNSKGYEPGNCYWATSIQQNNNTRSNRVIAWGGKTQTLALWVKALGINRSKFNQVAKRLGNDALALEHLSQLLGF